MEREEGGRRGWEVREMEGMKTVVGYGAGRRNCTKMKVRLSRRNEIRWRREDRCEKWKKRRERTVIGYAVVVEWVEGIMKSEKMNEKKKKEERGVKVLEMEEWKKTVVSYVVVVEWQERNGEE